MTKIPVFLSIALMCVFLPSESFAFGAIAVSDQGGGSQPVFALVIGYKTVEEANNASVDRCKSNGGGYCRVLTSFDRCGAIATFGKTYGVGWGIRGKNARIMALRSCGNDDCVIVDNQCEDY